MAVRIQLRRDTAANWLAADPVLSLGEVGIETDTLKSKVGNGSATWTSLSYLGTQSPDFSGTPTAPTASAGTNTTQIATTAFTIANRGDRYLTSSSSNVAIGTGSKSFTVETGLSYIATQDITIVYNASNHMHGSVTSYDSSTGALVVNVVEVTGSGTYNSWSINVGGLTTSAGTLLSANNLSDVQSTSSSLANIGGVSTARQIISGTGLSGGGDLTADRTLSVSYGSTAGTACEGNDSRLSDSRSPSGAAGGALTGTYPNPGIANVAIADGGTGATTASGARTNLGLGNVENTTLSTWAGSINISTVGTVSSGIWRGSPVDVQYGGTGAATASSARNNLGLGNVENTALSTWAGSSSITTLGTISSGVWNGTAIAVQYGGTGSTTQSGARTNLGLGNVENTALSTWAGSASITTLGTVTTGTWNASAVAIQYGGTGATTASAARTNLGVQIGLDVQPYKSSAVNVRSVSSTGNILSTDVAIIASAAASGVLLSLPAASTVSGQQFTVKRTDSSSNQLIVESLDLIDGSSQVSLSIQNQSLTVVSNGSTYFII